jgi:hypothetical protein
MHASHPATANDVAEQIPADCYRLHHVARFGLDRRDHPF